MTDVVDRIDTRLGEGWCRELANALDAKHPALPVMRDFYIAIDAGDDKYEFPAFVNMPDPLIGRVVHVREVRDHDGQAETTSNGTD